MFAQLCQCHLYNEYCFTKMTVLSYELQRSEVYWILYYNHLNATLDTDRCLHNFVSAIYTMSIVLPR